MKTMRFIIIDDDKQDSDLCKLYVKHALPQVEIVVFNIPEEGLSYIRNAFSSDIPVPSILFLDINMNTMTGWEFLDLYDSMPQEIKNQITIYIVSSSIDSRDKEKASNNKYVKGYLIKPATVAVIKQVYENPELNVPITVTSI